MKVSTNSVLTVDLDNLNDGDFLDALGKIAKRDGTTLEKAFDGVLENFFSSGGEPPDCPKYGKPPKMSSK